MKVVLEDDSKTLNEVVVVGYGTMRKKDLTGSVVQIKPEKLADQNPGSVQDLLRGTPGLQIGFDSSAKGSGASIQLRGQNSLYTEGSHNSPLIILDGMQFNGELSEINPDDIVFYFILFIYRSKIPNLRMPAEATSQDRCRCWRPAPCPF